MYRLLLDTMLLTLLVVGTASRDFVSKHRRLQPYGSKDFDLLVDNIPQPARIVVTPNTLSETSNWVKMIGEPARSQIAATFGHLINIFEERYVASKHATQDPEFQRFWLTDSVLLIELTNGHILLTSDFPLYEAALRRGLNAVNFNDLRAASFT
ncbi:MAG: hypothetical protein JO254_06090 [Pseudolabrys sp.]|nr:hypothetical protein [Pseudolabrys sp.]